MSLFSWEWDIERTFSDPSRSCTTSAALPLCAPSGSCFDVYDTCVFLLLVTPGEIIGSYSREAIAFSFKLWVMIKSVDLSIRESVLYSLLVRLALSFEGLDFDPVLSGTLRDCPPLSRGRNSVWICFIRLGSLLSSEDSWTVPIGWVEINMVCV